MAGTSGFHVGSTRYRRISGENRYRYRTTLGMKPVFVVRGKILSRHGRLGGMKRSGCYHGGEPRHETKSAIRYGFQ